MAKDGAQDARSKRVVALLEDCVRTELQVTNGMLELGLAQDVIEAVMAGVTSGVLYGFDVDWNPDWTHGEPHHWAESGRHFARCRSCLLDSPARKDSQAAMGWVQQHEQTHQ
jgi:hypothetical protein